MKYIFQVRVIPPYTVDEYAAGWIEASRIIGGVMAHGTRPNLARPTAISRIN